MTLPEKIIDTIEEIIKEGKVQQKYKDIYHHKLIKGIYYESLMLSFRFKLKNNTFICSITISTHQERPIAALSISVLDEKRFYFRVISRYRKTMEEGLSSLIQKYKFYTQEFNRLPTNVLLQMFDVYLKERLLSTILKIEEKEVCYKKAEIKLKS